MTTVRAKFKVQKVEQSLTMKSTGKDEHGRQTHESCELRTIVLQPVYSSDPSHENAAFWAASPSGEIRLGTINQAAWEAFELGAEYYIDFTKAEV